MKAKEIVRYITVSTNTRNIYKNSTNGVAFQQKTRYSIKKKFIKGIQKQ